MGNDVQATRKLPAESEATRGGTVKADLTVPWLMGKTFPRGAPAVSKRRPRKGEFGKVNGPDHHGIRRRWFHGDGRTSGSEKWDRC